MRSCLYEGAVRHRRHIPLNDEFRYPLLMAYLDLDELPALFDGSRLWSARGPAPAWFRRSDHLGDPEQPLADSVRALVRERIGVAPEGPIALLTHLRYFGHCFNPVSFYYCFDRAGERVSAVAAEVTNTPWGERHTYVLGDRDAAEHGSTRTLTGEHQKQLHVSPLMGMDHVYRWQVSEPAQTLSVHIASHAAPAPADARGSRSGARDGERYFDATLSLSRREISPRELRRALVRYPLITVRVVARIYAHALRLRMRGASYFPHPGADGAPT